MSLNLELRWNDWLERAEIRGGVHFVPTLRWPEWNYIDDSVVAKLRTHASATHIRFCAGKDFFWDVLLAKAQANKVDPAIDLLDELAVAWDRTPRLNTWLSATCGVPCDPYHQAVGRNIIGGMVRRIRNPGCKHDGTVVFIGEQGTGKSTMIAELAPRPGWFSDTIKLGDESKELVLSLAGKCIVEISEMGTSTKDVNAIKAMLSRTTDAGRTAYARAVSERPRRNIFVGSTNDDSPLVDATGNRRWLPVRVAGEIDLAWMRANARQLIGEAAHLEAEGADFAMPRDVWGDAADRQDSARERPEFEIYLAEWFAPTPLAVFVTAADLSELVKAAAGRSVSSARYVRAMRDLGFIAGKRRVDGKPANVWHRGELATATRIVPTLERGRTIARVHIQVDTPIMPLPVIPVP